LKSFLLLILFFLFGRCDMKIETIDPTARQSLEDLVSDKSEIKNTSNTSQGGLGSSSSVPQGSNGSNWVNGTSSGSNGVNTGSGVETTFGGTTGTNSF